MLYILHKAFMLYVPKLSCFVFQSFHPLITKNLHRVKIYKFYWPIIFIQIPFSISCHYCGDFTRGFDTQNYPKLQASLGTQPENTHRFQRQTQPNPYPWIFSGNTLGYPRVPALNFYPWVPWVPVLNFYPWVPWTQFKLVYIVYWEKMKMQKSKNGSWDELTGLAGPCALT